MVKLKKKEEIIFTWRQTLVIILILIVVIVILLWIYNPFKMEPDYTIYKRECHNETDQVNVKIMVGCTLGCMYGCMYNWTDSTFDCMDYCRTLLNETKEVCNKVEVDKIGYCSVDSRVHPNYTGGFNFECRGYEEVYYSRPISEINKEWLMENCRDVELMDKYGRLTNHTSGEVIKANCGDYLVELK